MVPSEKHRVQIMHLHRHLPVFLLTALVVWFSSLTGCTSSEQKPPLVQPTPSLTAQTAGTAASFIGMSPVDENIVWISGTQGTYARTVNGGATWQAGVVPGADSLQFRDVYAVDATTAYLLSIGPGDQSRIYKTTDAGQSWTRQFTNPEANGFFDCMDFWDAEHGMAFSDSVDGTFLLIITDDGGTTWRRIPPERLPPASPGEGSFAASGTCLVASGDSTAWIGTAAGASARVLKTTDRGRTWTAATTPIIGGTPASGIASLVFPDAMNGFALGGALDQPDAHVDNVAVTRDGGATWTLAGQPQFSGAVYGGAYVPDAPIPTLVATGPKGIDYSVDNGMTWTRLDTLNHWSVAFANPHAGWAIGPEGRITKIRMFDGPGD